ncbi:MAG: DUF4112 domain-containing protein [Planctomycetaceae bacterium]|nr:DUF4112 domain-containing protein [Planctomycetaceae bacterium]
MATELITERSSNSAGGPHDNERTKRRVYEPEIFNPDHEARLQRIVFIAQLMDDAATIPGTDYRVGWDSIIGLVPGIGDVASALISSWIVYEARQLGLPKWKLARMMANIGIDTTLGIVPLVGDFFDATYKANRKNAHIVLKHFGRHATS